jgi:predicted dinucleotide-binding enzyme
MARGPPVAGGLDAGGVTMRYAVLGTGEVGRTLGGKLVELGHEVSLGSRTKDNPAAAEWADGAGPGASHGTFAEAAAFGEVVVNAVGGRVALPALRSVGEEHLDGKVVLDVSNPLAFEDGQVRLSPVESDSVGEQIQRAFPQARVVKSLNTVNCHLMVDPAMVPGEHQIFVSGEDGDAKEQVTALLGEFGWPAHRVLDLGGIATARATEMYLPLWLTLFQHVGHPEFNVEVRRAR